MDARSHAKKKKEGQQDAEENEEDQKQEEVEAYPSHSDVEKIASQTCCQRSKTTDLRKQLEAEERTQKQLEEKIA